MNHWKNYKSNIRQYCLKGLKPSDGLPYWQNQLFALLMIYIPPIGLIAALPGLIVSLINGLPALAIFNVAIVVYFTLLTIIPNISILNRKILFILGIYSIVVAVLIFLGIFGPALIYMLAITIFAALIFTNSGALITVIINTIICISYGFIIHFKLIQYPDLPIYSVSAWIAVSSNTVFLSLVIGLLGPSVLQRIDFSFNKLNKLQLRLKKQKNLIAIKEQQYRTITNTTEDKMWSVDLDFRITFMNDAFKQNMESLLKTPINIGDNALYEFFGEEMLTKYKKYYQMAFNGTSFSFIEHTVQPKEIWSKIAFYPMIQNNKILGAACFSKNITEEKLKEKAKSIMLKDLEIQNHNLQQFSYIVSHNLRGPVANIIGMSNLLNHYIDSTKIRTEIIEGMQKSVSNLDAVIHDLNSILRLKKGDIEANEWINIKQLVNDVISAIDPKLLSNNVEIHKTLIDKPVLYSSKSYLQNIIYNLLTNSIKYRKTTNTTCVIHLNSWCDNDNLFISVKDNGLGIDLKKYYNEVFGLYKRFHNHVSGRGLGLYMVKTQIEALGGEVDLKSEINKGTTFTIKLPLVLK